MSISPLLSTPAEIRELIYTYTLVSDLPIDIDSFCRKRVDYTSPILQINACEPPLIRTCQQIRAEGLPIYYSQNHFSDFRTQGLKSLERFLQNLAPKKCAMITIIKFHRAIVPEATMIRGYLADARDAERALRCRRKWIRDMHLPIRRGALWVRRMSAELRIEWVQEDFENLGNAVVV